MNRILTPYFFTLIVIASLSFQACVPSTQIPTATIALTPTEIPLFFNNQVVRKLYEENPLWTCSSTADGWECENNITQTGIWSLKYYSQNSGDTEFYDTLYIDFNGLGREAIGDVEVETVSIISDEAIRSNVIDWVVDQEIAYTLNPSTKGVFHEVNGIYVYYSMNDITMSLSICHGKMCTGKEITQQSFPSSPTESKTTIGNLSFDLPPGWCQIDDIHISSVCKYTRQTFAGIEFSPIPQLPASERDAIVDFIKGFEDAGFQILDYEYLSNLPSIEGESVTMAKVVFIHPDYQLPPSPELVASFKHDGQYYLLWANLVMPAEEGDFQYLYNIMLGLLEGMSFVR